VNAKITFSQSGLLRRNRDWQQTAALAAKISPSLPALRLELCVEIA
jgi:hypothetical protein